MKASVDLDVFREAADAWFDTMVQVVNNMKIPDVED
jgi:hypothetical protein